MTKFLIDPTEKPPISSLGKGSLLPQGMGADVVWQGREGVAGLQRKTYPDLIASARSGHLLAQIHQMQKALKYRFVALEGTPVFDANGKLQNAYTIWTREQQWGIENRIQREGVFIFRTRSALETVELCERLYEKTQEESSHSSLLARPSPRKNGWGQLTDEATFVHIVSGFPGVGTELATRIFRSGKQFIKCGMSKDELMEIPGVGKRKADAILRAFGEGVDG